MAENTLTFMFSDIQDSSRLWDEHEDCMRRALVVHNEILTGAVGNHRGTIVKDLGDGFMAVFDNAHDAIGAALVTQQRLATADWEEPVGPLRVRLGLHSGTAEARDGDYFGPEVNRTARLEASAHGGQVLVSEATRALAQQGLGEEVELRDLGYHTLRGLARPERVYQLVAPGLPDEFPPPRTVGGGRVSFPIFATSFVGRTGEMSRISDRLSDPDTRVITLLGPGGIGKTRLAVETANQMAPGFAGGTAFADLVRVADPDGIPLVIAQALGAHPEGSADVMDIVVSEISDPTLLVLDNFEHVIAGSPVVADLIARCPELTMLVTSRTPLRIRGETIHQMEPLSVVSGDAAVPPAVDLFVDRAAANGVQIDLDGPDRDAVYSICRRLDGLPLAIELVAARVRLLNVVELDRRLGESLSVLGSGAADLPERQQTIQSTIDWSIDTLTPDQRTLFNRLSVFPAGATLAQVEHVAAVGLEGDALDLLSALVDHSLVTVAIDLPGDTRFRQLTVLRDYAAEHLQEADEVDLTMSRLVDHYSDTGAALGEALDGGGSAFDGLETDYPNLSIALEWSLSAGRAQEMARVAFAIWPVWFNGDRFREAAGWVERARQAASSAELDWLSGFLGFQTGDFESASVHLHRALSAFEAAGDTGGVALSRVFAGGMVPDPAEGKTMLNEALVYFEEHDRHIARFVGMLFLSVREAEVGGFERALALRLELLGDPTLMSIDILTAWAHWNIAVTLLALERTAEAADHGTLTLKTMSEMRYQEGIASVGEVLAVVETRRGRPEKSVLIHGGCAAVWDRLGIVPWFEILPLIEEAMAAAREQLGDAEYERLLTEGRSLSIDGLVELMESV
ncbi:MAG: hypothetical protein BMS9Abin07_0404 [Acidimicrobiia bacterium]|nr:MAG: hypothetical protein BMS9Abin07_0404 [Acidimicrobiia bacterium]